MKKLGPCPDPGAQTWVLGRYETPLGADGWTGEARMSEDVWLGSPPESREVGWAGGMELSID